MNRCSVVCFSSVSLLRVSCTPQQKVQAALLLIEIEEGFVFALMLAPCGSAQSGERLMESADVLFRPICFPRRHGDDRCVRPANALARIYLSRGDDDRAEAVLVRTVLSSRAVFPLRGLAWLRGVSLEAVQRLRTRQPFVAAAFAKHRHTSVSGGVDDGA